MRPLTWMSMPWSLRLAFVRGQDRRLDWIVRALRAGVLRRK